MQRVVYSLYIDIPKEEIDIFDKNLLKKGDTPININTKNKFKIHYGDLCASKEYYAKQIGADFKMFEYGPDYIVYANQLKEKYPYLTTYNIINFYKIHLMYELGKYYDEILYLDFDVVPIQNINFFEHWDLTKGIAVLNNNDRTLPIESVTDTSQTIRSPSSKYFNAQAMLFEKNMSTENDVINTGIVGINKDHLNKLDYFKQFEDNLTLMKHLKIQIREEVIIDDETGEANIKKHNEFIYYSELVDYLELENGDHSFISKYKVNCEEERLLGVSLTGIMDSTLTNGKDNGLEERLERLRDVAVETNKLHAEAIGIPQSAAVTCVKPSGTVSQLVDSASGIHARHNPYYIRTVRADKKDPLAVFMEAAGFPVEQDVMSESSVVYSFPVKAPESSVVVKEVGAMEQLKLWKTYQNFWCEHKPSITVYYTDDEYLQVAQWIWDNFDICSGISLLPVSDHVYQQAPYEDITAEKYDEVLASMPSNVNWNDLVYFEQEDNTTGSQELACVGGACEIT